jgi:uncharacterized repeat protein (TIGR02543 family)
VALLIATLICAPTFAPTSASGSEAVYAAGVGAFEASVVSAPTTVGYIVYFGRYPQSDLGTVGAITTPEGEEGIDWVTCSALYFDMLNPGNPINGGIHYYQIEPIAWKVLENADGKLFLLARDGLDAKPYHAEYEPVTWEASTARSWLNGYGASYNTVNGTSGIDYTSDNFIGKAFTAGGQGAVITTTVENPDNPTYGNPTQDKVFYLSIREATTAVFGFDPNPYIPTNTRNAKATDFAKANGASYYDWAAYGYGNPQLKGYDGNCVWWLRSPGDYDSNAAFVNFNGYVYDSGFAVNTPNIAVCPAFNLNLDSVIFTSENGKTTAVPKSEIPQPTIITTVLLNGEAGTAYSQPLSATSPYGLPVTWSLISGALPYGLTLDTGTGVVSGTPTAAGTYNFTIQASNGYAVPATKLLSITIAAIPTEPTAKPATVKITFNANGGKVSGKAKLVKSMKRGAKLGKLATPTRKGHKFKGWYTEKSGGNQISAGTRAAKNTTYYAQWNKNVKYGKVVNAAAVNVRKSPSPRAPAVGALKKGKEFNIKGFIDNKGDTNDWYAFNYKNKTGYIHAKYVKVVWK